MPKTSTHKDLNQRRLTHPDRSAFSGIVLKAATGKQARVINVLTRELDTYGLVSGLKRSNNWSQIVRSVTRTIKGQPLRKLQTIAG